MSNTKSKREDQSVQQVLTEHEQFELLHASTYIGPDGNIYRASGLLPSLGPFKVRQYHSPARQLAVVDDFSQAYLIASFAAKRDIGGYGCVAIEASDGPITHRDAHEWLVD
ncbi:hypothetical protein [Pusillimonas sp. T7-7]|uniref:hypothetical protein n=1 Tax=Pusillimonas sp. (strain T7-7) TaxID=1007105 RepID=UPI00059FFB2A|nr:hypothetical protein [Pusillimonas sp. T7-7]